MRVLHVTPSYAPAWRYGGPIRSIHSLCAALAKCGDEVDVFTTSVDGSGDLNVPLGEAVPLDGVRVFYFASGFRRVYWSQTMRRRLLDRIASYDVVHVHSSFLWPPLYAARAASRAGVPYVVSPRGMLSRELIQRRNAALKTVWIHLFDRRMLDRAAAIHFTSVHEKDEYDALHLPGRLAAVVPNGIDEEEYEQLRGVVREENPDRRELLFVGRVSWEKGLDRVIRALPYLPGVNLTIAGNDELEYGRTLRDLAVRNGVADRITFSGPVNRDEKLALFARSTALVLPSYSENFGNIVLEAMAARVPAFVTAGVGAGELIARSGCGAIIRSAPEEMAEDLARGMETRRLREMSMAADRDAHRYRWQHLVQDMRKVYLSAMA